MATCLRQRFFDAAKSALLFNRYVCGGSAFGTSASGNLPEKIHVVTPE